jgi:hypothetical protein
MEGHSTDLLVYTPVVKARTTYIFKLIINDLLGVAFDFTTDENLFSTFPGPRINYSGIPLEGALQVVPAGLLEEKGINSHKIGFVDFQDHKAPFAVYNKLSALPFDMFSAAFFIVSRYEEYLPYIRDEYGRFSSNSSIAAQKKFLHIPVINRWAKVLGQLLTEQFPGLKIKGTSYNFLPTIDIDAAWAYKNKGLIRSLGGFLKGVVSRDLADVKRRFQVMMGATNDPFDTFPLIKELHQAHGLRPHFFILFAEYGLNDKNIPVGNADFQVLVKSIADYAAIGIHPSYASNSNPALLSIELSRLSSVLHRDITSSRQHFLKLSLPETYRNLLDNDIKDDYTMGYAACPGFRAGLCSTFKWFDLESEVATSLNVHPFAIMDGTLRDYMKVESGEAMAYIKPLVDEVKNAGGTFISLWHNESLSNEKRWKGWVDVYKELLVYAAAGS